MHHRLRFPLVAAAILSAAQAFAADKSEPLWHKACGKEGDKGSCYVEQFAIVQPQNQPVLHIRFDLQGGDGKGRLIATVPVGVLLPPGLRLSVDGAPAIALPFERCDGQGCFAVAVLDKAALEKFQKGERLIVQYTVSEKVAPAIPIKLEGLADALKSLSK